MKRFEVLKRNWVYKEGKSMWKSVLGFGVEFCLLYLCGKGVFFVD